MSDNLKVYCVNVDILDSLLILSSPESMLILCHNFRVSLTLDNQSYHSIVNTNTCTTSTSQVKIY